VSRPVDQTAAQARQARTALTAHVASSAVDVSAASSRRPSAGPRIDNGKVTTVQAYIPVNCQQDSENVGYEILIVGVNLGLQKHGNGTYSFKANAKPNPKAVIKGTWSKSGNKVTGTIVVAPASLKASCTDNGGVGANPPIPFTATRQPS